MRTWIMALAIAALACGCGVDTIGDRDVNPENEVADGDGSATAELVSACPRGAITWDECPRPTCCPPNTWACLDGSCAVPPPGSANGPNWCVWDGVEFTGTSFCSTWYPPNTCADLGYEEWTCPDATFACCPAGMAGCADGTLGGTCAAPGAGLAGCRDLGLLACSLVP